MQKKLIALAIAGLAAAPAFAQSNVTIYGFMDMALVSRSGSDGALVTTANQTAFNSGVSSGSRLGFKGSEPLGNGTSALFQHEFQLFSDVGNLNSASTAAPACKVSGATPAVAGVAPTCTTTNGTTANSGTVGTRNSYVGLTGNWGTAVAGHIDGARYGVALKYDAFSGGTVGQGVSMQTHATRADNAIAYISPTWSGFSFIAAYTTNLIGAEKAGNNGDARLWAFQPNYNNGPLSLTLNFEHLDVKGAANDNGDVSIAVAGGSYDFGVVKAMGYWESVHNDGTRAWDQRAWMLGATAPIGANGLLRAGYSRVEQKNLVDSDCNKFGIGYKHSLSKRTYVFTDYARINNEKNAACAIGTSGSAGSLDNPSAAGVGTKGFDLGIGHSF